MVSFGIAWQMADVLVPLKHLNFKPNPNVESNPSFGDVFTCTVNLCCLGFCNVDKNYRGLTCIARENVGTLDQWEKIGIRGPR